MKGIRGKTISVTLFLFILILIPENSPARVTGYCNNCHTMHYSQGGGLPSAWGTSGPYNALLMNDCVGCHTAPSGVQNTGSNEIPYINQVSGPTYGTSGNTLAGGSFYWMAQGDDTKGHNANGIANQDGTLGTVPPGGTDLGSQITCAGSYGCHGDRGESSDYKAIYGAHHATGSIDGTTVGTSYRFLLGVVGYEDSDWEYQPSSSTHNQYKGVDRAGETEDDSSTIGHLCGDCHGDFHHGTGNIASSGWRSPWFRHPTDYDMGNTPSDSEYRNYGGATNEYNVVAPVASEDVSSVKSTVNFSDDTIVTCISCHRAHGSPYFKLLRWDYRGNDWSGCGTCHTWKQ